MRTNEVAVTQGLMSFDDIAAELGVSRQRAHQIYTKAMAKLKRRKMRDLLVLQEICTDMRRNRGAYRLVSSQKAVAR